MAEESGGDGWWGAWGTDLLANVKAKSAETFSLVKHDLTEFVTTIQHDTTVSVAETANQVKEKLKVDEDETDVSTTAVIRQGVSQWLGSLSTALKENISQMSAIVDDEPTNSQPGPVFDRAQARVHEIQTNPATYCNDPDGHPGNYQDWCRSFDLEQHKADISELLVNKPEIRSLYTKLVPAAVTHALFWTRYFYKMHRFEQEEMRKAALVERANKMEEEEIGWDDEEESWDVDEASLKDPTPKSTHTESPDDKLDVKKDIQEENFDRNPIKDDSVEAKNEVTETKCLDPEQSTMLDPELSIVVEIKREIADVNKAVESSSETKNEDVERMIHSDSLSSIAKEEQQQSATVGDDGPRESSTPEPYPSEENNQQVITKHKRTTSNVSEGKDELHRENDSNSSVDSSWSKLSDEDLKQNMDKKTSLGRLEPSRALSGPSPSQSELSSSSVVVVPPIDDRDLDWDDDEDFDLDTNNDDTKKDDTEPVDDDDDDWENWE